jgi:leucyl/phenylalanyl-tRNA--protein transferase
MSSDIAWLESGQDFPHPSAALKEPDGLLAAGGDLGPDSLIKAYRHGIFPWYSEGQPPLWWSPDPRAIIFPNAIHISRSLKKEIRKTDYQLSTDTDFSQVIRACTKHRDDGTWILPEMMEAYEILFQLGYAHSVELWFEGELVGGLYGVTVGNIFCGESMFSSRPNASKIALTSLAAALSGAGFQAIDCQIENPHLVSLGAQTLPRAQFLDMLASGRDKATTWPKIDLSPAELLIDRD